MLSRSQKTKKTTKSRRKNKLQQQSMNKTTKRTLVTTKSKKALQSHHLLSTISSSPMLPLNQQQKRLNYSFVNLKGPKDTRYLEHGEQWVPPKAQLFENGERLVFSSMILERPPICLPKAPEWEVDWYQYRQSKLSENAWVLPKDLANNMYGKYGVDEVDYPESLPHITEDDKNNDRKSLYRGLDEPLFLLTKVKQDFNSSLPAEIWMFPTTEIRESETIRTAAERTLFYHAGDLTQFTLGNTPIIHHDNQVSKEMKKDYPQVKRCTNFYMHAMYLGGKIELEPDGEITDYVWAKQSEFGDYFTSDHTKELLKLTSSSLYYLRPE